MNSEIIAHKIRGIILRLINKADGRIELEYEDGKQFIKLDGSKIGETIDHYASDHADNAGLASFAETVIGLQENINQRSLCNEEMMALSEFIPEDKRSAWIGIW